MQRDTNQNSGCAAPDQRNSPRQRVSSNHHATVWSDDAVRPVRLVDISACGFSILLKEPLPEDTMMHAEIDLPVCGRLDMMAYPVNLNPDQKRYRQGFVMVRMGATDVTATLKVFAVIPGSVISGQEKD